MINKQARTRISDVIDRLREESKATAIILITKNGELIAASGEVDGSTASELASASADYVASADRLGELIGEPDYGTLFQEGKAINIHITTVVDELILFVLFDEKSSLGLVRLRTKEATTKIETLWDQEFFPSPGGAMAGSPPAEDGHDAQFTSILPRRRPDKDGWSEKESSIRKAKIVLN